MTVAVTGASSGIGAEAAREFARRGHSVVLAARRLERLEELASELEKGGARALPVKCDVSDPGQVSAMRERAESELGPVDILVNNAGFAVHSTVADSTAEQIERQVSVNFMGAVRCTKEFLPGMLERGSGSVVSVASVAASMGLPGIAAYCATKSAMLVFSEGLRHELAGTGVNVTVVSPIMVRTEFFDRMPRVEPSRLSLDPRAVARAIVRASGSPRLELVVPWPARAAVWLKQAAPFTVAPLAARIFKKYL